MAITNNRSRSNRSGLHSLSRAKAATTTTNPTSSSWTKTAKQEGMRLELCLSDAGGNIVASIPYPFSKVDQSPVSTRRFAEYLTTHATERNPMRRTA